ncbi:MAG: 4-hydroxy-3-methylbut-2-enyl diphosphate reductase [Planctomycetes bacterium]|nr:4-hydroxy-3-methylbut-2-enyl diphosphate reductase [Planctomycetota bacterium]
MKLKLAKTAGFCWGVKRALELVLKTGRATKGKVYTFGPLIHNEHVVNLLTSKGIKAVDPSTISSSQRRGVPRKATIIIRAHGISPDVGKKLARRGYQLIDATCPHVRVSQKKVATYARQGYQIIIAGDKKHAEVTSLNGYARAQAKPGSLKPRVISSSGEARSLKGKKNRPVCIVAQSTFQEKEYQRIIKVMKRKFSDLVVLNTICRSTTIRQREVLELADEVKAMIVVGARHSANTTRLTGLARTRGIPAFHIADVKELPLKELKKYQVIGLTAGTSTPDWIIQPVIRKLKKI